MTAPTPARPLRRALGLLLAAALALSAVAASAAPASSLRSFVLLPRQDAGLGTVSSYGGVTPVFAADAAGADGINIPDTGKREVNLVWTFWSHRQPSADLWPVGPKARSVFTLRAETAIHLDFRVTVRVAGEWTELLASPSVTLAAGKPAQVSLALPDGIPHGSVEVVRVRMSAEAPLPALRVTDWTIATVK